MATKTLTGTPAWLGAMNDRAALSLLLEQGTLTRNQLAALSGLSKPTAAQMIARLDANGLVGLAVLGAVMAGQRRDQACCGGDLPGDRIVQDR